ncbi:hypothetical protein PHYC_02190 [Phycisphaerales bacterium]|nr:hypothetical protein PHYC_02190 [Phycisphaerales bacterium]
MNLNRRTERLEKQQRAAHEPACPACGVPRSFVPRECRVRDGEGANEPEPGDWCSECGRQLVIRIQFDKAG